MKKSYGAISALLLALASGAVVFTQEDFDRMYVCPLTNEVQRFDGGLSSTGLTGYPDVRGVEGQLCRKDGKSTPWRPFCDVAHENGYDCTDFDLKTVPVISCEVTECSVEKGCVCFSNR